MEEEIWKPVATLEDRYEISNTGRLKSLPKKRGHANLRCRITTGYIAPNGYAVVSLGRDGHYTPHFIHRLVAEAFIPNPFNKPCVDHIDGDKSNNCVNNLRWCTIRENLEYPKAKENWLSAMARTKRRSVIKMTVAGEYLCEYGSMTEAARDNGILITSIANNIAGRSKQAGGYKWRYKCV